MHLSVCTKLLHVHCEGDTFIRYRLLVTLGLNTVLAVPQVNINLQSTSLNHRQINQCHHRRLIDRPSACLEGEGTRLVPAVYPPGSTGYLSARLPATGTCVSPSDQPPFAHRHLI